MDALNREQLAVEGYTVVKSVISATRAREYYSQVWAWLERTNRGLSRYDESTWVEQQHPTGWEVYHAGIGYEPFTWAIRGDPVVKSVFVDLWSKSQRGDRTAYASEYRVQDGTQYGRHYKVKDGVHYEKQYEVLYGMNHHIQHEVNHPIQPGVSHPIQPGVNHPIQSNTIHNKEYEVQSGVNHPIQSNTSQPIQSNTIHNKEYEMNYTVQYGTYHEDLLTSLDGGNILFPGTSLSPCPHIDQSKKRRGLQCIQGFLNLIPCGLEEGGHMVLPGTHLLHDSISEKYNIESEFYRFTPQQLETFNMKPVKVQCQPGDLVLWDSRTVHWTVGPSGQYSPDAWNQKLSPDEGISTSKDVSEHKRGEECETSERWQSSSKVPEVSKSQNISPDRDPFNEYLPTAGFRAVVYVCMTPTAWATEEVLNTRIEAFKSGYQMINHSPHEPDIPLGNTERKTACNIQLTLSESVKELIGGRARKDRV